ncbi:MAG TPA: hypothetical protein VFA50_03985 [Stellaceae bacterium]|nr:hypothetical protein [Stellaceae bacterium]
MSARQLCRGCTESIAAARASVAAGAVLDLAGLDAETARMCEALPQLPPAERQAAAQELRQLITELDLLTEALRQQHDLFEAAARRNARDRAAEAYTQAAASGREDR